MKNVVLLLILISGFVSGYFVGDYRGKEARQALKDVLRTGQSIDEELRSANTHLKSELATVDDKYKQDMATLNSEYRDKSVEWQRTKDRFDDTIRRQNARLAELNGVLGELIKKLGRSEGTDKTQLEQKITILRNDIDALLREMNGNACLKAQVPPGVIDVLNGSNQLGRN